jgi:hypothetical protein
MHRMKVTATIVEPTIVSMVSRDTGARHEPSAPQ